MKEQKENFPFKKMEKKFNRKTDIRIVHCWLALVSKNSYFEKGMMKRKKEAGKVDYFDNQERDQIVSFFLLNVFVVQSKNKVS